MQKDYYTLPNGIQAISICRYLDFNCGNIVKYVVRAGRKLSINQNELLARKEDLEKALDYLKDEIKLTNELISESEIKAQPKSEVTIVPLDYATHQQLESL